MIGCVYIYPPRDPNPAHDVHVSSWVRADRADLDPVLYAVVALRYIDDLPVSQVAELRMPLLGAAMDGDLPGWFGSA